MATKLHKPVTREVTTLRGASLMVTFVAVGITFREKGRRSRYLLPYGAAFIQAVRLKVDADRRAKLAARKAKRAAKRRG